MSLALLVCALVGSALKTNRFHHVIETSLMTMAALDWDKLMCSVGP